MKSRSLSNNKATQGSIIQAMMVLLLVGGVSYYVATQAIENQEKARHDRIMADTTVVTNQVFVHLADPFKCTETFSTSFSPNRIVSDLEMTPNGPAAGTVEYDLNAGAASRSYGNENITITSYEVRDSTPHPQLHINYGFNNPDKTVRSIYHRTIDLYMEWEDVAFSSNLIKCQAITDLDRIWSVSTGNSIYYYGDPNSTGNGRAGVMRGEPPMAPLNNSFEVGGNVLVSWPESTEHATQTARVTAQTYEYDSDRRHKKNIRTISDATELVKKLRGVSFEWTRNQREDFGFVAQELQRVFPELVSQQDASGYLSVDYGKLTGVMLQAVKEQSAELRVLRAEVERLQSVKSQ